MVAACGDKKRCSRRGESFLNTGGLGAHLPFIRNYKLGVKIQYRTIF
jgi:hypothetical protein